MYQNYYEMKLDMHLLHIIKNVLKYVHFEIKLLFSLI